MELSRTRDLCNGNQSLFFFHEFLPDPLAELAQVVTEEFQVSQLPGQILKQSCVQPPPPAMTLLGIPGETLSPEFPTPKPKKNCSTTHLPPPQAWWASKLYFRVSGSLVSAKYFCGRFICQLVSLPTKLTDPRKMCIQLQALEKKSSS